MSDSDQFEAFMRAYQDMVFTTAARLLGNSIDAEDVSQEVFLRAFDHFDELRSSPTAGGWLKTVATHLCLNHLTRYRARWRFFSEMDQPEAPSFESNLPDLREPRSDAEENERRLLIETALRRLPDHQRVPLVLFHFQEMPYEEIAARLRVSLGKIKTDIHRARQALRRALLAAEGAELRAQYGLAPAQPNAPTADAKSHE